MMLFLTAVSLVTGCVSYTQGELTPKQWGDKLDVVPLGTSISNLERFVPEFTKDSISMTPNKFNVALMAMVNPFDKDYSGLKMYRQHPSGILIHLNPGDYYKQPKFYDGFESTGEFVIFFDSQNRYQGYFGYSSNRKSQDEKERFEHEKEAYRQFGIHTFFKAEIEEYQKNKGVKP